MPGYDPNAILIKEMVDDSVQAIALLKAIAGRESGRGNNLTEEQWRQAHRMYKAGSADAFFNSLPAQPVAQPLASGAPSGAGLVQRARAHIGEQYVNTQIPKDDPHWHGPWDCAEFVSWLVYQEAGTLYGCVDDTVPPAKADAYTGAWKADLDRLGKRVSVEEAAATVGGIVLRYPPGPGKMGHIAVCDGNGGTIEAKGRRYGVVADTVQGPVAGTAYGIFAAATGGAVLIASIAAGLLWSHVGHAAPFVLGAASAGLAALLILVRPRGAIRDVPPTPQAVAPPA